MEKIKKFYHVLMKVEECIFCVILLAMACVVTLQVFFRYVLGDPLTWTEELSRFLFVWLIAFAAGYCVSTREHIRVELVVDMLPKKVQKVLDILMTVLPLGVFVYMIPTCVQFMIQQNRLKSTALRLPYSYVYGAVVVASVLLVIHLIGHLIITLFDKENKDEEEHKA